jgi:DNA-binding transcriptional regulator YdaS (Cro superfamily)
MTLIEYINSLSPEDRSRFEGVAGTSIGYLRKAASAKQVLGAATCVGVERASGGVITRKQLRPEDWHLIWPELAAPEAA